MFSQFYADIDELHRRVQALPLLQLVYLPQMNKQWDRIQVVMGLTVEGFYHAIEAIEAFSKAYQEVTK